MLNLSKEEVALLHGALVNSSVKVKDIAVVAELVQKIETEFHALSSQEAQPKEAKAQPKEARSRAKK